MAGEIKITGGAQLAARLSTLPDRVANNVMRGATLAGASVIRDRARVLAPILAEEELARRDPTKLRAFLTRKKIASLLGRGGDAARANLKKIRGFLRRNILSSRGRGTQDKVVAITGITKAAYYGHFLEFGTRKMRAHPFMRPAFDQSREAAVDAMVEYAKGRVEEEAVKNG